METLSSNSPIRLRPAPRVLIVIARYYPAISDLLHKGAVAELDAGHAYHETINVSGSLEIPIAIAMAHQDDSKFEGYIALGCVIRGETTHYEIVSQLSAQSLLDFAVTKALAVTNGILTVENEEQALARALPEKQNKGGQAARACLELIASQRKLKISQ
jgi:6,7-dimethyl-8-ribityllumazine synthase